MRDDVIGWNRRGKLSSLPTVSKKPHMTLHTTCDIIGVGPGERSSFLLHDEQDEIMGLEFTESNIEVFMGGEFKLPERPKTVGELKSFLKEFKPYHSIQHKVPIIVRVLLCAGSISFDF